MAGPNGGARPGAGRKPKAEKFKLPIARAEKRIADKLPDLIDRMLELSEGVLVEGFDISGAPRIYQRPPDYKAISYLVDRIMGKPTERQEVTGADGNPISVEFFNHDAAIAKLTQGSEDDPETPE